MQTIAMHFGRYIPTLLDICAMESQMNDKHHKHSANLWQKIYIMCLVEIELNLSLVVVCCARANSQQWQRALKSLLIVHV